MSTLVRRGLYVVLFCAVTIPLIAQDRFTRLVGPEDKGIPLPAVTGVRGRHDADGLREVIAYLRAVGFKNWVGMQATGTITPRTAPLSPLPATLTILGEDKYRLDIQKTAGTVTIRYSGPAASIRNEKGLVTLLPDQTAAVGLFAFPHLFLTDFGSTKTTLTDQGIVQVDNRPLHRLSSEVALRNRESNGSGHDENVVTDFYFDPTSHLLVKSATLLKVPGTSALALRVVTYDDYRAVDGTQIPFRYVETLNGSRQWSLQLNSVQLRSDLDPTTFQISR